jgi:lipopolysaccharide export system ATP-binding protein
MGGWRTDERKSIRYDVRAGGTPGRNAGSATHATRSAATRSLRHAPGSAWPPIPTRRTDIAYHDQPQEKAGAEGAANEPAAGGFWASAIAREHLDLSLEVSSGEVVGLLGPNGAGKTTAFYMIVGLVPCDDGRIWLDDRELTGLPMHRRARLGLGYLPQEARSFALSVEDNIRRSSRPGRPRRPAREEALERLLEELHVAHLRDHLGMSLSGGERRRLEIARALAADPSFILLDEPFAGVDPLSVHDIQRIVRHLAERGIGILITDHNVRETLGICGRAYIVNQGSVLASGSAEEILANAEVRKVYLGHDFRL